MECTRLSGYITEYGMEIVYIIIGAAIGYGLFSLKNKLNKPPRPKPVYEMFKVEEKFDDQDKGFPLANIFIIILIVLFVVAIIFNM